MELHSWNTGWNSPWNAYKGKIMTAKQVEVHGEVIKWYCDNPGKGVWCKFENCNNWELRHTPRFDVFTKYIQNDEYAELRKAQADGKTIQYYSRGWYDLKSPVQFGGSPSNYRVNLDEPTFKIGDWLRGVNDGTIFQLKPEAVLNTRELYELWEPKEGDVVVCWITGHSKVIDTITMRLGGPMLFTAGTMVKHYTNVIPYVGQSFEDMEG